MVVHLQVYRHRCLTFTILRVFAFLQSMEEVTLEVADKVVAAALAGANPTSTVLLSSTINSPSSLETIRQFQAKYPGSRHVVYDAISYSGILLANEACYGKRAIPSYRFDKAKVIC